MDRDKLAEPRLAVGALEVTEISADIEEDIVAVTEVATRAVSSKLIVATSQCKKLLPLAKSEYEKIREIVQ